VLSAACPLLIVVDLTYLWPSILDCNLHVLVGIFLPQQRIEGLIHVDKELSGVSRCLIYGERSVRLHVLASQELAKRKKHTVTASSGRNCTQEFLDIVSLIVPYALCSGKKSRCELG
jgi:hypothetical protein